MEENHEEPQSD